MFMVILLIVISLTVIITVTENVEFVPET